MSKKFIEPIVDELFYAWVAPDGTIQFALMSTDIISCIAIANVFAKYGIGKSPDEMKKEGYTIEKIKVTAIPEEQKLKTKHEIIR